MSKRLTAEQYIAIEWLSIPNKGGKTYEEIAKLCGVHFNTLANWRKDKTFDAELKRAIIRNNSEKLPQVVESMAEWAIREGNAAAAKLVLQINGMLTDKVEVETKQSGETDVGALAARIEALKRRGEDGDPQE